VRPTYEPGRPSYEPGRPSYAPTFSSKPSYQPQGTCCIREIQTKDLKTVNILPTSLEKNGRVNL
jgi:hypothetical protein